MDIVNDTKKTIYCLDEDYDNASKVPSKLRRGYFSTNENLKYIKSFDIKDKDVLTICGSGDHAFMSLINGAKRVDTFDTNPLQYYILELKRAAILGLSKEDYLKFFPIYGSNPEERYNIKYYKLIRDYLHEESKLFWDKIYSTNNYDKLYLLELFSYSLELGSNYTLEYDLLKRRLLEDSIKFYYTDIYHISNCVNPNTYKLIMLSNVFDHIYQHKEYNEIEYLNLIEKEYIPLLTNDGSCVFHYQLSSIPIKSFKNYTNPIPELYDVKVMSK